MVRVLDKNAAWLPLSQHVANGRLEAVPTHPITPDVAEEQELWFGPIVPDLADRPAGRSPLPFGRLLFAGSRRIDGCKPLALTAIDVVDRLAGGIQRDQDLA